MRRLLVANRGEIAVRVIRACFDEGIESVAAVSAADRDSLAARMADRAVVIGPAAAAESYLSVERVVGAALASGCDALHPGYGFLSERPELAAACEENDIAFVGPPAAVIAEAGDKMRARAVARSVGVPTGGGSDAVESADDALAVAAEVGYPLMLKAAAGGGGRGMAIVDDAAALEARFASARAEALQAFGDGRLYVERYVARARHVEVQVLADGHGAVRHLGERDCSCQRRYQKLVEEAPAVGLPEGLVEELRDAALRLAQALSYRGAGTVEFLVDVQTGDYVFLEVNARVQVEHPVSEMVTGIDVVREQLRIAAGEPVGFAQEEVGIDGHAIECRINAEDPDRGFAPAPGTIGSWVPPLGAGIRLDTHCHQGAIVPPHYDSLLGKLIVHGENREAALDLMRRALERFQVEGVATTIPFHLALMGDPEFAAAPVTTRWVEESFLAPA